MKISYAPAMKSTYFEDDDILQIRVSDKPIVRETSQGWRTHISYAEDGTIVEIVLLEALRDPTYFGRCFVDAGPLCWPNGLELSGTRLHELVNAAQMA